MIDTLFEKVAGAITHRPKLMLGLLILVFFVALYGMTQISMETGTATYLNKDSEKGILNDKYTATFQSDTLIFIIETSDPLDPNILAYVDELEANVRQQQNIKSVYSIVDILKSMNGGELPRTRAEVDAIVALIPPETRTTAVPSNVMSLVQIQLSEGLSEEARNGALDNVISVVDASSPPPGTKVTVTGSPAFAKEMSNALMSNMGVLIGGAMILMIVVMGILFAYVRYRFLPVVLVGAGLITSLGLMGLAGIQLNMAVVGAFPVLIGLGIDYAIQFHARFDEESRKGSLGDAVFMTVTRTGPAVMYAMLATCMGFLAMFISPVPDDPVVRPCIHYRRHVFVHPFSHRSAHHCSPAQLYTKSAENRALLCGWRRGMRFNHRRFNTTRTIPQAEKKYLVLWPVSYGNIGKDCEKSGTNTSYRRAWSGDRVPDRHHHPHRDK